MSPGYSNHHILIHHFYKCDYYIANYCDYHDFLNDDHFYHAGLVLDGLRGSFWAEVHA